MSGKLPAITPRKLIKALEKAGFEVHHIAGSHHILRHKDGGKLRITVPFHNRDLKAGTLHRIIKDAGLGIDELLDLL